MATVGFELEVNRSGGNAGAVLENLRAMGLTSHTRLHQYHCGCSTCESQGYLFKAQEDCTAGGEFITRILEYGTRDVDDACIGISRALLKAGSVVSGNVGNHVHVDRSAFGSGGWRALYNDEEKAASRRLMRLFARYERDVWEIAAGPHADVRGYNGSGCDVSPRLWEPGAQDHGCNYHTGGHTLCWKEYTVEFRLWNATREAWRIRTHVGISHAFVLAAIDGADCTRHDVRPVEEVLGDYFDGPTWAGILRQRFHKGGIAAAA